MLCSFSTIHAFYMFTAHSRTTYIYLYLFSTFQQLLFKGANSFWILSNLIKKIGSICVWLSMCLKTVRLFNSNSNSKDIQQFGCAWIIKVKMRESTRLQGALPASLIIHQRPIYLQTAGIQTNLFLTDSPFLWPCLCLTYICAYVCVDMYRCVWSIYCVFVHVFLINDLQTRNSVPSRGQLGEVEDVSCLSPNRFA